ncbi:glycosyltransferase family 2 protein [Algirhabdus cladophorae]|uniref:glycosyltransferase family 2 protein n=1 Tax=Algirhabdus cladophorae TaxID=3377108 RepID=UPI003B84A7B7
MRIYLHIGLEHTGAQQLQETLAQKRDQLAAKGVLFPKAPGNKNHTRLFMAMTDPDHVDTLRYNRGYTDTAQQAQLLQRLEQELQVEVDAKKPRSMILSCSQLATGLARDSELQRLKTFLNQFSDDIRIIAHVDEQGRMLARHYAAQISEGRTASLSVEAALAGRKDWRDACLDQWPETDPRNSGFAEVQAPPFWLDYQGLVSHWDSVFGQGVTVLRPYDPDLFYGPDVAQELCAAFDLPASIGRGYAATPPDQPSAASLTRGRLMNEVLVKVLATGRIIPRNLWKSFVREVAIDGAAIAPGSLVEISKGFEAQNKKLLAAHPALTPDCLKRDRALKPWTEAAPERGFRATQYLTVFMGRIERSTRQEAATKSSALAAMEAKQTTSGSDQITLSDAAKSLMPPLAKANFEKLKSSSFAPHNKLGAVNEEALAAAYTPAPLRDLPRALAGGNSGNVIVGCMKNECPYIVEWVAYHRAIGVDNFIIYTNGCEDGTSELLDTLQDMGILQHRNNDNWKGNSPQQYALNQSLKEPLIQNAEWIIHIDVDEFMNVRCGNGTLSDLYAQIGDATNIAMTWRLFGHNGVTKLSDDFVIDQFDTCAPKFCPKPHTVWGFKTMFKNIGAYEKISCHRPNKLDEARRGEVKWVNGSGKDMTADASDNGWRNSKKNIGYDLLQLNHYALRSAESFLIKRQRGRALHVDRSIGINYWVRMDWSVHRDITIKRNIPRVRAEYDRLLANQTLRKWHQTGLDWHRAKAEELHQMPEFADLYAQALKVDLTEMERVAYALALDMES